MELEVFGKQARAAAGILAKSSGAQRDAALWAMAEGLQRREQEILSANAEDLFSAKKTGMSEALQDRLRLTPERLQGMRAGILEVRAEADPLGKILGGGVRPNGLKIEQITVPLGVIGMIYEARPNVTSDAAALCMKSGNAVILRGGKEAIHSNTALSEVLREAIREAGLPEDAVQLICDTTRASAEALMRGRGVIDLLIPRGGAGLIRTVIETATVPVIETGAGVCHAFVERSADLAMAVDVVENAKCSRPSVCNALETVLVEAPIASEFLSLLESKLETYPVKFFACAQARAFLKNAEPATEESFGTEYGDLSLSVKVVPDVQGALAHIARYGTKHSECILTERLAAAEEFLSSVDAAAVYVNASTRFTDGGMFGFGAEIGISTQKLHARGPLGLRHLTSDQYRVYGSGQVR